MHHTTISVITHLGLDKIAGFDVTKYLHTTLQTNKDVTQESESPKTDRSKFIYYQVYFYINVYFIL